MCNENIKTLWKFQELTQASEKLSVAEHLLQDLRRTIEEAKYKAKGTELLPPESISAFGDMEQALVAFQHCLLDQTKIVQKHKNKVAYNLESLLGGDEE